jgi:hypothetical protein
MTISLTIVEQVPQRLVDKHAIVKDMNIRCAKQT